MSSAPKASCHGLLAISVVALMAAWSALSGEDVFVVVDNRTAEKELSNWRSDMFSDRDSGLFGRCQTTVVTKAEFKAVQGAQAFILEVTVNDPVVATKKKSFSSNKTGTYLEATLSAPYRLSYRPAKGADRPIVSGTLTATVNQVRETGRVSTGSSLTVQYEVAAIPPEELKRAAVDKVARSVTEQLACDVGKAILGLPPDPSGGAPPTCGPVVPVIALPPLPPGPPDLNASNIGRFGETDSFFLLRNAKRDPKTNDYVIPVRNTMPVNVSGQLAWRKGGAASGFDLKPGGSQAVSMEGIAKVVLLTGLKIEAPEDKR